ncbi:MAG: Gfo/Idh/MocA family protein [Planctomycetaceae bacterium]
MSRRNRTRREFLTQSTAAALAAGFWASPRPARASRMALDVVNFAAIGVGGKGRTDIRETIKHGGNLVALCDVDDDRAKESYDKYPKVERFADFRQMLEKRKDIDAVIVTTPDHQHAVASIMAMKLGKHVYCQKPLVHDIYEARMMDKVAKETNVVTQMGNQGHASEATRRIVELVQAGVIGKVSEVHCWTDRPGKYWPQPVPRPTEKLAIPKTLNWDLWLGTAPERPYHKVYVPHDWRGFWDFGCGAIGDMGCHVMDPAYWALNLGLPTSVEAVSSEVTSETPPQWEVMTYQFPARAELPPVTLKWYDAGKQPPQELGDGKPLAKTGSLLIGDKGTIYAPVDEGKMKLLPEEKFRDFKGPDPSIPRTDGPYKEWLGAIQGGSPTLSNFDYASKLTETVLLGNLAVRVGKKIEWDAAAMKATNVPEAAQYVQREYRKGWTL